MRLLQTALIISIALYLAPAQAQKSAGNMVDDSWLHTKVKTALVGHGGGGINIEVYLGHVQLAGFVDSDTRKEAILAQAKSVENVAEIHDQIFVVEPDRTAGQVVDDNVITGAVKGALTDSDLGRGIGINVEVNRGVVLLSGFVDNREERGTAITIAESVDNVQEVINGMDLKPTD